MGSQFNFKMGDGPEGNGGSGRPPGNFSLTRQPSIYSLTFDEIQNTMGGLGKDFGSMNMDEFLKNIWTAEEAQAMGAASASFAVAEGGAPSGGNLQRQGSLTLPRTISTKTVDEVWRDVFKESGGLAGGKDGNVNGGLNLPQRQPTFGEITLEEFLVRAGVVREDAQQAARANNSALFGEVFPNNSNSGLSLGFGGQPSRTNGVMATRIADTTNPSSNQPTNLGINVNGVRSSQLQQQQQHQLQQQHQQQQQFQLQQQRQQQQQQQQQKQQHQQQQQQQQQHQKQQHIFPKQPTVTYSPIHITNTQLASPGARGQIMGIGDPTMNNSLVQGGGLQGGGMGIGLGAGAVTIATGSPVISNGLGNSNGDTSSVSPVPYVFNGGLRGKRSSGAVEKVVERRQRRMIKNRESAARSRARKQAYTMELEAEVAKLKEANDELEKKQKEIKDMQKSQIMEILDMVSQQQESKKRCLRRTLTGPW